jgi:hypothetical protein
MDRFTGCATGSTGWPLFGLSDANQSKRMSYATDSGLEGYRKPRDDSRHAVYKRYFTPEGLLTELGAGTVLHTGHWFVAVLA